MHVLLSLGLVLLVACSQSRGVFKLGPDTYITSAAASPTAGVTEAQRLALTEANEYCANMGKKVKVMKSSDVINIYGGGTSKVTFQCLTRDPNLQRQGVTKPVDVCPCWHQASVALNCKHIAVDRFCISSPAGALILTSSIYFSQWNP
jgi:hypothetical protein